MKAHEPCPDGTLLSRMIDHDLAAAEKDGIVRHLASCPACTAAMAELSAAAGAASAAARRATGRPRRETAGAVGAGCLSDSRLSALVRGVLGAAEASAAEAHLQGCDHCLAAAAEAIDVTRRLAAPGRAAVPASLRSRVASRWASAPERPSLAEVVVRIARDGLELVGRSLGAGVAGVEELALAAPTLRGGEPSPLRFVIRAHDAEIRAKLVPDGGTVALTLTLVDARGRALGGQRVLFRLQQRSVFSARTDDSGELVTPRLEAAVYEVSCPGIATDFRLDLRA